jgi:hypothetical protein
VRLGGRAGVELHAVRLRVSPCTHLSDAVLIANVAPLVREGQRATALSASTRWLLRTKSMRLWLRSVVAPITREHKRGS